MTIKTCKNARKLDCREALFTSGERPDRYSNVRSTLELWGFSSYVDYVCTVCEMAFLEGLLPSIDIGYVTFLELKKIRRICASLRIMLDGTDAKLFNNIVHQYSENKQLEQRLEVIRNAGELKLPVTTGIMVGIGETITSRKEALQQIRDLHREHGHIQNVVIQDFVPQEGILMKNAPAPSKQEMIAAVEMAREIIPEDVAITIHPKAKESLVDYIKAGANDLGSLSEAYWPKLESIQVQLEEAGYTLRKRLPIFERFVLDKWYSRKLGQVMDRYRLMLKQEIDKREAEKVALATNQT